MKYFYICITVQVFILLCRAQNNYEEIKDKTIKDVIQKLGNVTVDSFSDLPSEEKDKILSKIEEKLKKSTFSLGPEGQKYVKFIMYGVKLVAYNNTNHEAIEITPSTNETTVVPRHNTGSSAENETQIKVSKPKDEVIRKIANKIELLGKNMLKNAKTPLDKQKVMEKIKRRVMESAKRKQMVIHDKYEELKSYSDLIVRGVDLAMRRNLLNNTSRMDNVIVDNFNVIKENSKNFEVIDTSGRDIFDKNILKNESNTPLLSCKEYDTCAHIRSLSKLSCNSSHGKTEVAIGKLCDGTVDCFSASDEQDCATQAVRLVRDAGHLMREIESALSRKCLLPLQDSSLLKIQNQILSNVLETQLAFIQKHSNISYSPIIRSRRVNFVDKRTLKKTVHEVAAVVSSLASALEKSLCSNEGYSNYEEVAQKYNEIVKEGLNEELKLISPSPFTSCACNGQLCASRTCSTECKRVCFQKYNLNRWLCESVIGGKSISLDMICDGKFDCYDETDENDCAPGTGLAKFEASVMFDNILNLLVTKSTSKEYAVARSKLLSLHTSITMLEKLSVKRYTDIVTIKGLRDQCFTDLTSIYEAILNSEVSMDEINDVYMFLLSLNVKLVSAMKRSHSGNDRIISSDGCFCRDARCAQPTCTKTCVRACSAEPTLTRYLCDNDRSHNMSVPIEHVCNGQPNCPNKNDEKDCVKEVCRKHHLILLSHNIKDAGERHRGTALGEALKSWKTKVTARLKVAENNDRPTPRVMRDIVSEILHDLVMAYASLDDFRRSNNDYVLKEFWKLSQTIIAILKSCGQ